MKETFKLIVPLFPSLRDSRPGRGVEANNGGVSDPLQDIASVHVSTIIKVIILNVCAAVAVVERIGT